MSGRAIFIHIGLPKTGTTSIQFFLALNAEQLKARGLLYPEAGRYELNHAGLLAGLAAHCDRLDIRSLEPDVASPIRSLGFSPPEEGDATMLRLRDEIASFPGDAVLSLESLAGLSRPAVVERFARLFEGEDVRIVAFLRRQDFYVFSFWQQLISTSHTTLSFDQYLAGFYERGLEDTVLNYGYVLDTWAECFGRENVIVGVYEQESMPDAVAFFLSAVRATDRCSDLVLPTRMNEGTHTPFLEFFSRGFVPWRLQHEDGLSVREFQERYWSPFELRPLLEGASSAPAPTYIDRYFDASRRVELLRACEPFNERIAREYLGRESGALFAEPWPDPSGPVIPPVTAPETRLTQAELSYILFEMVLALQDEVRRLKGEINDREDDARR